jgi:hypothetical protein
VLAITKQALDRGPSLPRSAITTAYGCMMARLSPLRSPGRPPPQPPQATNAIAGKILPHSQKAKISKPRKPLQEWAVPCDGRWRGWTSGVTTPCTKKRDEANGFGPFSAVKNLYSTGISSPSSPLSPRLSSAVTQRGKLGFPNDLIGGRPLPHLAAFLSSLWRLPSSVKTSFCGGWKSVPIRPLPPSDPWPRVGIGSQIPKDSTAMDPKGKNTKWDRQIPKPQRQNSPPWGRHRNLSWRLRPPQMKVESKPDLQAATSGESADPGNMNHPTPPVHMDLDLGRRLFCQKCGEEGHHARECSKPLWCEICRKETHVTAKCVWPKQSKPTMPIVGMAADGLGFYASQFAKNATKKPRKSFLGLVKVIEGEIRCEDLEQDFSFHFPWGKLGKPLNVPQVF